VAAKRRRLDSLRLPFRQAVSTSSRPRVRRGAQGMMRGVWRGSRSVRTLGIEISNSNSGGFFRPASGGGRQGVPAHSSILVLLREYIVCVFINTAHAETDLDVEQKVWRNARTRRDLRRLRIATQEWRLWLNRRGREADGMSWQRFSTLLREVSPLPPPRIVHPVC
jgi:hypothetical protein